MAEITKPSSLSSVWAAAGDKIRPAEEKIQQGWVVEIPMFQHENWLTNRQDQAIAHFNQHGIPAWDSTTQYVEGKSYVQGPNGLVYKALVDNVSIQPGSDSNVWGVAFVSSDDTDGLRSFNGYIVVSGDISPQMNKRYYALNSLIVTLPLNAATGDNVILNKMPQAEVTIQVDSSGTISTSAGAMDSVKYDIPDELNVTFNGSSWVIA